jgi:hypothetical protein
MKPRPIAEHAQHSGCLTIRQEDLSCWECLISPRLSPKAPQWYAVLFDRYAHLCCVRYSKGNAGSLFQMSVGDRGTQFKKAAHGEKPELKLGTWLHDPFERPLHREGKKEQGIVHKTGVSPQAHSVANPNLSNTPHERIFA